MAVLHVKTDEFETEVLKSDKKVLVDFYADWCGPCKMMAPILDELSNENTEIKIAKVNVDEESAIAEQYKIMSIPTLIVFDKGEVYKKSVGLIGKADILELLQ